MVVPRENVVLPIYASTTIKAPASHVYEVLLDAANYGDWNQFCPKVEIEGSNNDGNNNDGKLHLGTVFTFMVVMDEKKKDSYTPTRLKISDLSTPDQPSTYVPTDLLQNDPAFTADLQQVYRIAWHGEGGFVSKGLKSERFHEIILTGENECEVRTWECQGGMLAKTVKWMYGKTLMAKFQLWCDDLKAHCEKTAGQ